MRALLMTGYGGWDRVRVGEAPDPTPGELDLLVQVHAAGLNPLDVKTLAGKLRLVEKYPLPVVLGNELAGTVIRVGAKVTKFRPGDHVYGRVAKSRMGACAERALLSEGEAALKPRALSFEEAAGVPLASLTALQAIEEALEVKEGQTVLVHAGAGGVGSYAIQFAKKHGARVVTTGGPRSAPIVEALGADIFVNYEEKDFAVEFAGAVDAVFDTLGGAALEKSFGVLKPGGRLVSISGMPTPSTRRDMPLPAHVKVLFWFASRRQRAAAKARGATYDFLFMRPDGEQLARIASLIDGGGLSCLLDRVFEFEQGVEALRYLETGRAKGKVVLRMPVGWRRG